MTIRAISLMGPTASGKTALALALHDIYPIEIISVDAVMVYRGMDIGSAKPDLSERARVPHHGIDIINPDETFSVAQFCALAHDWINEIHARKKIPLLTGGTMMYFHALQNGLSRIPHTDTSVRLRIEAEGTQLGWPALHTRLQACDPVAAAGIKPHDTQRLTRALAVFESTGKPLSSYWQEQTASAPLHCHTMTLMPSERPWLHTRIAQRFQDMLHQGLLDETAQLIKNWGLADGHPALRSVGYRQACQVLQGTLPASAFFEKGVIATRQLAKRQMTWLRSFHHTQHYDPCTQNVLTCIIQDLEPVIAQFLQST